VADLESNVEFIALGRIGICAILAKMDTNHHIWRVWANALHRWGIQNLVASFLEAAGPLTLIGAQAIYVGQPILKGILPAGHLSALTGVLEDDGQREDFIYYLLEETS
jgi:hypothetical protein